MNMAGMPTVKSGLAAASEDAVVFEVAGLHVSFATPGGAIHAVNGVGFSVRAGETLAILGESGCGKSVTVQAIMGLVRCPPGRVRAERLQLGSLNLLHASAARWRTVRGARMAMIFQDPFMSLDPSKTVGQQIGELFVVHRRMPRAEARCRAIELMERVRIPSAARRVDDYPHQFSGGMRQRIMIAGAIALEPEVLIADEPTTALDVTVQAQIMDILAELRNELRMAMVLITHDLRLAALIAERALVMYAGRVVETGPMQDIYSRPHHPYTIGLLKSLPALRGPGARLQPITGSPPVLSQLPVGCAFAPRCPWRQPVCERELPPLRPLAPLHSAACHFAEDAKS
jgi:oligopeptide transport system ATP-binding protein